MILGLDRIPAGECFRELDDALVALGRPDVILNAHAAPDRIPPGATVYCLETPGIHFDADPYPRDVELWTCHVESQRRWQAWGREAKYVPIGHHQSMERFHRSAAPDIDIVHVGCLNERRGRILRDLGSRDLNVVVIGPGGPHGAKRDAVLARAKLVVAPLYYEGGLFGSLRAAHLVANQVPCVFEDAPEAWRFVDRVRYEHLVQRALAGVTRGVDDMLRAYRECPMELPC